MREFFVRDYMTKAVLSLAHTSKLAEAVDLARARKIRHVPVLQGGRVVGIVSDRDMLRALPSAVIGANADDYQSAMEQVPLSRIMTRDPETVGPDTPLADAVERMLKRKISALPVTDDNGRLLGIITETDCQAVLLDLLRPRVVAAASRPPSAPSN